MTNLPAQFAFESFGEADTDRLGQRVAAIVEPGLTMALNGQLGSGKTRFVRSLAAGLGVETQQVSSPTFVLLQLYTEGRIPIAHFDTYRLADVEEFLAIGADEFLTSTEWLCLIEWADRVGEVLPADRVTVQITQTGTDSRRFEFRAGGPVSSRMIDALSRTSP